MNTRQLEPSPLFPMIWLSQAQDPEAGFSTECDCVCDACFDAAAEVQDRAALAEITAQVRSGELSKLVRSPQVHTQAWGGQALALSAAGSRMVVMDASTARMVFDCPAETTLTKLRSSAPHWSEDAFVGVTSALIAQGIFAAPGARPVPMPSTASSVLNAWLELTRRCNLQCRYCYVPRGGGAMTPELARRAVQAVYRSAQLHGFRRVKLKYSGGEPTLNFSALLAADSEARALSARTGIGCDAVMLTNGVALTGAQIDHLAERGIRVMISLDGLERTQELNRPAANRTAGALQRTLASIDRLLERGVRPHISITITALSLPGVPELVELLLEKSLTFSLNFYRQVEISPQPDPLLCTPAELVEGMLRIYQVIERRLPPYSLWGGLTDRAYLPGPHRLPCAAGHQYLVIDHAGAVARCQMEISLPAAHIDDPDPLANLRAFSGGVQNLPVDERECASCLWRYRCSGGCPRLSRGGARSPLCDVYRQILPEAARLEALRLVAYQPPLPLTGGAM